MLKIHKTIKNTEAVFELDGRLDTTTAPELELELRQSLDGVENLILDLEKLEYISSAGLRVLLLAVKLLHNKGTMKVVHANDLVMEVFEVTGFSDILTIE